MATASWRASSSRHVAAGPAPPLWQPWQPESWVHAAVAAVAWHPEESTHASSLTALPFWAPTFCLQGSTSFDSYISILEKVTNQVWNCAAALTPSSRQLSLHLPVPLPARAALHPVPGGSQVVLINAHLFRFVLWQDFVLFLYSAMSRTIMEIFSEASRAAPLRWSACVASGSAQESAGPLLGACCLPASPLLSATERCTHPPPLSHRRPAAPRTGAAAWRCLTPCCAGRP